MQLIFGTLIEERLVENPLCRGVEESEEGFVHDRVVEPEVHARNG